MAACRSPRGGCGPVRGPGGRDLAVSLGECFDEEFTACFVDGARAYQQRRFSELKVAYRVLQMAGLNGPGRDLPWW